MDVTIEIRSRVLAGLLTALLALARLGCETEDVELRADDAPAGDVNGDDGGY